MLVAMSRCNNRLRVVKDAVVTQKILAARTKPVLSEEPLGAECVRLLGGFFDRIRVGQVSERHSQRLSATARGVFLVVGRG